MYFILFYTIIVALKNFKIAKIFLKRDKKENKHI